ncbi:MAG: hypothetical protein ACK59Y_15345 [Betaproteobacteria bacterium]|jgi:hypothetical protein
MNKNPCKAAVALENTRRFSRLRVTQENHPETALRQSQQDGLQRKR